jgi:rRNA maturation protein Rpf1
MGLTVGGIRLYMLFSNIKFENMIPQNLTAKTDHINHVTSNGKTERLSDEDFDKQLGYYKNASYRLYVGDTGSTARYTMDFCDKDDKVLFTITDLGNRDLIVVEINGSRIVYQKASS